MTELKKECFESEGMKPYYYEKEACAMCNTMKPGKDIFAGFCHIGGFYGKYDLNDCYFKHQDEELKSKYAIYFNKTNNHNIVGRAAKRFGSWPGGTLGSIEGLEDLKRQIIARMKDWVKDHRVNQFHEMTEKNLCFYSSVPGIDKAWIIKEYQKLRLTVHPPDKVMCDNGEYWYYKKPKTLNNFIK